MYHVKLQGKEKERLLLVRRNLEDASIKLIFYRLLLTDVQVQEQCQKLVKSARALEKENNLKEREYQKLEELQSTRASIEAQINKLTSIINSKKELQEAQVREKQAQVRELKEKLAKARKNEKDFLIQQELQEKEIQKNKIALQRLKEREKEIRKEQKSLNQPHIEKGINKFRQFLGSKRESNYGAYIAKEAYDDFKEEYERSMKSYQKLETEAKEELQEIRQEIKDCFDREEEAQISQQFNKAELRLEQVKQKYHESDKELSELLKEADQIKLTLQSRNANQDAKIQNNFLYKELKEAREKVDGILGTLAEVIAPKRVLYLKPLVRALGSSVNHILVRDQTALLQSLKVMKEKKVRCTLVNLEQKVIKAKYKEERVMHKTLKDQSLDRLLGKLGLRFNKIVHANPSLTTKREMRHKIEQYIISRFNRHILAFNDKGAIDLQRITQDRKIISLSGIMQSYGAFYEMNTASILRVGKLQAEKMLSSLIEATREKGKKKFMIKLDGENQREQDEESEVREEEHKMEIQTLQELGIAVAHQREKKNPLEKLTDKELSKRQSDLEEQINRIKETVEIEKKIVLQKQEEFNELERKVFKLKREKQSKRKIMEHLDERKTRVKKQLKELEAAQQQKEEELEEYEAKHKAEKQFKFSSKEKEELRQIADILEIRIKGKKGAEEIIEAVERDVIKKKEILDQEINDIRALKEQLEKLKRESIQKHPDLKFEIRDLELKIKNYQDQEGLERIAEEIEKIDFKIKKQGTQLDQLNLEIQRQKEGIEEIEKAETGTMQVGNEAKREILANLEQKLELEKELNYELSVAEERQTELSQLQDLLDEMSSPRKKKRSGVNSPVKREKRGRYLKERRQIKKVQEILEEHGIPEDKMEDIIKQENLIHYNLISKKLNIKEDLLKLQYHALQNMITLARESERRWKKEFERVRFEIEEAKREPKEALTKLKDSYEDSKQREEEILTEIMQRKQSIEEIRKQHRTRFLSCFKHINNIIHDIYYDLTKEGDLPGGSINLYAEYEELVHESIVYLPTPPGKGVTINSGELSSGELSIATIAFILAAHSYRPSAVLIFDEIDQYLDPMAMARLCTWMENRKYQNDHFQWILVTHKFNSALLSSSIISVGIIFKALYRKEKGKEKVVSEGKMSTTLHYKTVDYMTSGGIVGGSRSHESGFLNFERISELVSRNLEPLKKHAKLRKAVAPLN